MSEIPITRGSRRGPSVSSGRSSPAAGRAWRLLAIVLIVAGTVALVDAGVTLLWQEPFSALYAKLRQDHLSGALAKVEHAAPTAVEERTLVNLSDVRRRIEFLAGRLEHTTTAGGPVGRILIPRIGASFVVVKGTNTSDLESGPGIYSETQFPGIGGTTAIAGHRTTYLAPFRHIDVLHPGSRILLNMPYAHFTYTVVSKEVVSPSDVQAAVGNVGYSRLVLSACTPLFSAAKRLLVSARLTQTVPIGAGRAPLSARPPGGVAEESLVGSEVEEPAAASRPSLPTVLESGQANLGAPPT
jgi:sortase A